MINEKEIAKVLIAVSPAIQADGGDTEYVRTENGIVYVKLTGACIACPVSNRTIKEGVQKIMKMRIPEVKEVVNVNEPIFDDGTFVEL